MVIGRGWFRCDRAGCRFRRFFATERGAAHGIAEHLRRVHKVRLVLKSWAGPRRLFDGDQA